MALSDPREPCLTVDGELLAGREALQVPVAVHATTRGSTATLALEAQQAATDNRTVRLSDLSASDVRRLRDELDELLTTME